MKARSQSFSTPKKPSSRVSPKRAAGGWTRARVLGELKKLANPQVRAKMAYFGVKVPNAHGISQPVLHALARHIGKNHKLAEQLWASGIHEARILATLLGEAEKVTAGQMERWALEFDSWDVVDAACCYLYAGAAPAWRQVEAWSRRREEFVKRAAFSLVAYLSYKDKQASDARFERFLRVIEREARDERNFVRKAVNWALRNIGKRNLRLNRSRRFAQRSAFAGKIRDRRAGLPRMLCANCEARPYRGDCGERQGKKMAATAKATPEAKMKIRKARRNDAERLAQLSGELGYPATAAQIATRLRQLTPVSKHGVFVAESLEPGVSVVGWVHVSLANLLEGDMRAEVNGLVVSEGQRNLGAGAKLLQAAEEWARRRGCAGMNVRSNVIRERAHKFYERQGYEHYKTQKAFRKPL